MTNFPLSGIIHVCGEPDVGKTTFAITCGAQPKDIAFFDADVKGGAVAKELKFGYYIDLVGLSDGLREIDFHEACLQEVDTMTSTMTPEVIIWDGWQQFEKTFHPYVVQNPKHFRQHYSHMGKIKGAEMWLASFDYEAQVLSRLTEKAKLVILTTHLKNYYVGDSKVPGKSVPDCKRPIVRLSSLRLWLRHNPDGPEPIGLVFKRVAKHNVTAKGVEVVSVLPRRIAPCTWDRIRWYYDNPIGDRRPTPEEVPNEFELSLLDGTLTPDQKRMFELAARGSEDEIFEAEPALATEVSLSDDTTKQVLLMTKEGKPSSQIATELNLPLPVVLQAMS